MNSDTVIKSDNLSSTNDLIDDLKNEVELKFKKLKCFLIDQNESHFLNDPKILPCSNTACSECIIKSIKVIVDDNQVEKSILKCNLCKSEHLIENVKDLESNENIIDQLNLNSEEINQELINKLNVYIDKLKGEFSNREQAIEDFCSKAKNEIKERIDAIKNHLDILHNEMLESLALIKQNVSVEIDRLSKESEDKCQEYDLFVDKMQKMIENFEENRESLQNEIYQCQDYIDDLSLLDQNFNKILRKVYFEPSEWTPDEAFICKYIAKFNLNDQELVDSDDD